MIQRTTFRLDPELLRAAKIRAAEEGITLTALVERFVREGMMANAGEHHGLRLTRVDGAVQPGIDLEDRATLLRLMHEAHEPTRIESPTFDGGDPYPGVSLECNAEVLDRTDAVV